MTTLKPPCAPFLIMFGLNERLQDSQGQVRTQGNSLELLEVAMWVALTQHQTGKKFLFQHPAYASSWNTQMVSLATGLKGVMLKTVDLSTLGMADEDERPHCRMTTIMTNDSVVADAFRPYRCARDHKYASAGSRHLLGAQEHDRQFCEVVMTALKASLLHRDRREPRQLMTLAVRNDDEQEEDSGLDEDEQPAEHQRPTETQIKMVNQYHRNLGHPSRREFLKVLKAAHAKPVVLECVRREYRCADCHAHTKPQPSRKGAIPRTYEFNRIMALDLFYIPLRGQSLPILNIICHGTNFPGCCPHATRQDSHNCNGLVYFSAVMAALLWHTRRHDHWRRTRVSWRLCSIRRVCWHSTGNCRRRCTLAMGVWSRIFLRRASKLKLFSHLTIWKTFWQRLCR